MKSLNSLMFLTAIAVFSMVGLFALASPTLAATTGRVGGRVLNANPDYVPQACKTAVANYESIYGPNTPFNRDVEEALVYGGNVGPVVGCFNNYPTIPPASNAAYPAGYGGTPYTGNPALYAQDFNSACIDSTSFSVRLRQYSGGTNGNNEGSPTRYDQLSFGNGTCNQMETGPTGNPGDDWFLWLPLFSFSNVNADADGEYSRFDLVFNNQVGFGSYAATMTADNQSRCSYPGVGYIEQFGDFDANGAMRVLHYDAMGTPDTTEGIEGECENGVCRCREMNVRFYDVVRAQDQIACGKGQNPDGTIQDAGQVKITAQSPGSNVFNIETKVKAIGAFPVYVQWSVTDTNCATLQIDNEMTDGNPNNLRVRFDNNPNSSFYTSTGRLIFNQNTSCNPQIRANVFNSLTPPRSALCASNQNWDSQVRCISSSINPTSVSHTNGSTTLSSSLQNSKNTAMVARVQRDPTSCPTVPNSAITVNGQGFNGNLSVNGINLPANQTTNANFTVLVNGQAGCGNSPMRLRVVAMEGNTVVGQCGYQTLDITNAPPVLVTQTPNGNVETPWIGPTASNIVAPGTCGSATSNEFQHVAFFTDADGVFDMNVVDFALAANQTYTIGNSGQPKVIRIKFIRRIENGQDRGYLEIPGSSQLIALTKETSTNIVRYRYTGAPEGRIISTGNSQDAQILPTNTYIEYRLPAGGNPGIDARFQIKYLDDATHSWNQGNQYRYYPLWRATDQTLQSSSETYARAITRIDYTPPSATYTYDNANDRLVYNISESSGSGLKQLGSKGQHTFPGLGAYSIRTPNSVLGYTIDNSYSLNAESNNYFWSGNLATSVSNLAGSFELCRTSPFTCATSFEGDIPQNRLTMTLFTQDAACNTSPGGTGAVAEINSQAPFPSWFTTRGGMVYSGDSITNAPNGSTNANTFFPGASVVPNDRYKYLPYGGNGLIDEGSEGKDAASYNVPYNPFSTYTLATVDSGTEYLGTGGGSIYLPKQAANQSFTVLNYDNLNAKPWFQILSTNARKSALANEEKYRYFPIQPNSPGQVEFELTAVNAVAYVSELIGLGGLDTEDTYIVNFPGNLNFIADQSKGTPLFICDLKMVIMVEGNLAIDTDIASGSTDGSSIPGQGNAGCIFIVKGHVTIDIGDNKTSTSVTTPPPASTGPTYDFIEAFIVADGVINAAANGYDGLLVHGGLLSFKGTTAGEGLDQSKGLNIKRTTGPYNVNFPGLAVSYDPRYSVLGRGLFNDSDVYKQEVGFKP